MTVRGWAHIAGASHIIAPRHRANYRPQNQSVARYSPALFRPPDALCTRIVEGGARGGDNRRSAVYSREKYKLAAS